MGLVRLLFWIALIAAAFWLWRRLFRKNPGKPRATEVPMVRCAHCGVHVPQNKALQASGQWYCSQAHLERGRQPGGH
ncbi:PP0621 family protein [Pseudomonas oligotrophica]|uniref:PP0621 family protein n=1 Tax=Pseudomonas oligotrophica TaxID=2912055 RepID=UPI001F40A2F0|nr:PP0621 family protein [Pseudomonas oligotrophica]MCF7201595.1 hypothetical protein [Pseudomonas oligotrophica]